MKRIRSLVGIVALGCFAGMACAGHEVTVNIEEQPVETALNALAQQTGLQLLFRADALTGEINAPRVVGTYKAEEVLDKLLANTSLSYKFLDERTVAIRASKPAARVEEKGAAVRVAQEETTAAGAGASSDRPASNDGKNTSRTSEKSEVGQLEEIVVTAQKKSERLQDVPVPISVLSADHLVAQNQLRIEDFYSEVPGLTMEASGAQAQQVLSIRGISTGEGTNNTVGVVVDDIPFGGTDLYTGGFNLPDIDPGDLTRIEVLRGPQGTLYGAASMGGLLKFVTLDPSTDAFSGRVQVGGSSVNNGPRPGYNVRASVNAPLGDTWALRISGFTRQDPGYIDNPFQGRDGINEKKVSGGRLATMWRPSEDVSLKLSALYQKIKSGSYDIVNFGPGFGDLQQDYLPGVGGYERTVQAYSAILAAKLGSVTLTSLSGYSINKFRDSWDFSLEFSGPTLQQFGVSGAPVTDSDKTEKITQELRLSGSVLTNVDWLLGGFFTNEHRANFESILAENPTTGAIVGDWVDWEFPFAYREFAGFANLTYHFTDRFNVQVGGRESHIDLTNNVQTTKGLFVTLYGSAPVTPEATSTEHAFTYLVTPQFRVSEDLMAYLRFASGFRPGSINVVVSGPPVPQSRPDTTLNYEFGLKGNFFDRALTVDGSVYYIDWKDLQVIQTSGISTYNSNGSRAKSQGAELSLEWKPLPRTRLSAWISVNDAVVTAAFPIGSNSGYAVSGTRLPFSSRFSGNFSFQQGFPLWSGATGYVGGSLSYVGDRPGQFATSATALRQDYPAYAQANLTSTVTWSSWTVNLFVNNLTDRRGLVGGGIGVYPPNGFTVIRPRTVGLNVTRAF